MVSYVEEKLFLAEQKWNKLNEVINQAKIQAQNQNNSVVAQVFEQVEEFINELNTKYKEVDKYYIKKKGKELYLNINGEFIKDKSICPKYIESKAKIILGLYADSEMVRCK
ncbi:hypothetical protein [Heyndrickxia camelliae]|uniref:Uncharacterized protein n=1 Tax=Heyndrickxia camelliae TaxID=1707093 RepID=A0A2N3LD27_9BACI|nr:hypothetical protein [Heyndrickxia camelliae]PKR82424.1 hypothetical protein CWO92_24585 [Heyndrickxia camelliae]